MMLRQFPDKAAFVKLADRCNVIPVCAETLADMETPVSLMARIYSRRGCVFLFESVEGGERWGRYSFMGLSARSRICVYRDRVSIDTAGETTDIPHNDDPFAVLRSIMKGFTPADIKELPRFWGGLVGYMTYEMVSFIEKIPSRLPENQPLARFFIPGNLLIFDNVRNTLMLVALAFLDDVSSPEQAYEQALQRIDSLRATLGRKGNCGPDLSGNSTAEDTRFEPVSRITPEAYRARVQKVKAYIRAGDVIQTVISQPFEGRAPQDPVSLYRAQRYINPSPYLFFMQIDDVILVGSSPETMVRLENGVATLRPIAGTRPRGNTEQADRTHADDLLRDEKERAEHLMLVDLGRNDLGRVARTGTVQVTELMVVERYSHVMHLVSNIHCDLKADSDAWDLVRAAFPAGTLSGAPKVRAMEIIAELEKFPRGPYGGAVGYVSFHGNMDMAITIRTACIQGDRLTVRAGAGIVADSNPEKERLETVNKAKALHRALRMVATAGGGGHRDNGRIAL